MEKSTFTREYEILRRMLRESREQRQVTQIALGRRLGESQSFISKCERGERRLDMVQVRAFCVALGISFIDFAADFENRLKRPKRR